MENNKYALVDQSVFESIMQDCRDAALKVSDNLVEAHQLAGMLYESAVNPFDAMGVYRNGKHKTALTDKNKLSNINSRIENNIKAGKKPYTNLSKEEKMDVLLAGSIDKQNEKQAGSVFNTMPTVKTTKQAKNIFDTWTKK